MVAFLYAAARGLSDLALANVVSTGSTPAG